MKGPTRASVAGRTYLDLQNKARREKRPTQEFFDLYVLERFLVRLAGGEDRDSLILKAALFLPLSVHAARREMSTSLPLTSPTTLTLSWP